MCFRAFLIVIVLLCSNARAQEITMENFQSLPLAEFEARLPSEYPMTLYMFAARLFNEGKRDDAVKWFYIGQLRWRFHLAANPDLPRGGEPAALGALNASLGATINEWAGGAPRQLAATNDQALRWDEENENSITSKELHRNIWINQRSGLQALRDQVLSGREALLVERRRRGLEVRE
ncbi:MAG: hypothetical protein ING16_16245 [Roseomonas sp.]|jgi:hypothetical protein|nr:hypothetical protein [Roseomonas sp.]MCA3284411.1 hypothetical protein [Roseomonas sp.]MCA3296855.1 hypothetical protein [Roseomonas sp.]